MLRKDKTIDTNYDGLATHILTHLEKILVEFKTTPTVCLSSHNTMRATATKLSADVQLNGSLATENI